MCFKIKNILKNNHYYIFKYILVLKRSSSCYIYWIIIGLSHFIRVVYRTLRGELEHN